MPEPRRSRGRLLKWMWPALAALVCFAAWRFGPGTLRHANSLLAQRAMFRHTLASDMLVYDTSDYAHELLKNTRLYRPWPRLRSGRIAYVPGAFYYPFELGPYLPPSSKGSDGLLFMHRLKTPSGDDRLVIVSVLVLNMNTPLTTDAIISAFAYEPASLKPGTRLTLVRGSRAMLYHTPYWPPFRLWAGQPDPDDPTHFTIPYSLGIGSGTIDGWLRSPDQEHPTEHVVLDARDGPLDSIHGL